jgi:hypothetical protein
MHVHKSKKIVLSLFTVNLLLTGLIYHLLKLKTAPDHSAYAMVNRNSTLDHRYGVDLWGKGIMMTSSNNVQDVQAVSACYRPPRGYKAWIEGVITPIYPPVKKNCSKLLLGDMEESKRVRAATRGWKSQVTYAQLLKLSLHCPQLKESFRDNLYISEMEATFPIAYAFVVYDNPEQFLRLLRLLYRPGNVYCIHPDRKSKYYQFFVNIAQCFPNIITATDILEVTWGSKSVLYAQRHCLSDLDNYRKQQKEEERWKYVINLCGKELPLNSGREIVEKLLHMNKTSSVVAREIPVSEYATMLRLRGKKLPYNLVYHKSMTYNALSEPFVSFLLHNSTARKVYTFFLATLFPEEHYYATVFKMPGVPGGYDPNKNYFSVSHTFWMGAMPCHGEIMHGICVVNFQDLPRIMRETKFGKTALFHNKYFMELDHVIMDCMEERIVAKNKREFEMECSQRINEYTN